MGDMGCVPTRAIVLCIVMRSLFACAPVMSSKLISGQGYIVGLAYVGTA